MFMAGHSLFSVQCTIKLAVHVEELPYVGEQAMCVIMSHCLI